MAWLPNWCKRVKFTIDHTDVDNTLLDFPILLTLGTSVGRSSDDVSCVFDELQSDANRKKIAVTTSDGTTQCYVEIEKWDDANEKAWLWVKVPSISSDADTDLYLYYDSSHADNAAYVGDPSDAVVHNVWDSNFKFVSHMRDDPDTSHISDSTVNANDGTKKAGGEPTEVDGAIAKAQDFDGYDDYINIGNDASLDTIRTVEVIICAKTKATYPQSVIGQWASNADRWIFQIDKDCTEGSMFVDGVYTWTNVADFTARKHIALVWDGSLSKAYYDGVLQPNTSATNPFSITDLLFSTIGIHYYDGIPSSSYGFNGLIDEVRISATDRSAAWIKASYESERDDLLDWGSEETLPKGRSYGFIFG